MPPPQSLTGIHILNLGVNLPGPAAAARLSEMGAAVTKVEPPGGDPFVHLSQAWYHNLCAGQQVICLDLKDTDERARLEDLLAGTDLLLTASRLSALHRLDLGWERLHAQYPRLCQVAIVGYPSPDERAAHDLTYQAWLGLVEPPHLPRILISDLTGVERAVSAALSLLLQRERGLGSGYAQVSLVESAESFLNPLRYGLTTRQGPLGGGSPRYNLYKTSDGWVAVAALENHFWVKLCAELGLNHETARIEDLKNVFFNQTAQAWEAWAEERDLPVLAVHDRSTV